MEYSREKLERVSELFKVLSDMTRVQIIYRLNNEKCVSELAQELGMTHSAVSHQLSVLRAEKLVTQKRRGKQIYYRLSDHTIQSVLKISENYVSQLHN